MSPITFTLFIFVFAFIQNVCTDDPYSNAIVSLWRLDFEGRSAEKFVCVGALIKSNWILTLSSFFGSLIPFDTLGFFTGRSYRKTRRIEVSSIVDMFYIRKDARYMILIVNPGIDSLTPYRMHSLNLYDRNNGSGSFIGWNIVDGPRVTPVSFNAVNKLELITKNENITSSDFPMGSFIVQEQGIIAVCNNISSLDMHRFIKISGNMTQEIDNLLKTDGLRKTVLKTNGLQTTVANDPYPEAVVSFWHLDRDEGREKFLYVGALIESNWILVPRNFLDALAPFAYVFLYAGCSYETQKRINSMIVGTKEISEAGRFIILVIQPSLRRTTPYIAANADLCSRGRYCGEFIGWNVPTGPERRAVTIISLEGIYLSKKDKTTPDHFPLGSFIVRGKGIIAFAHNITREGVPLFLELFPSESEAIWQLLEGRNKASKRRRIYYCSKP